MITQRSSMLNAFAASSLLCGIAFGQTPNAANEKELALKHNILFTIYTDNLGRREIAKKLIPFIPSTESSGQLNGNLVARYERSVQREAWAPASIGSEIGMETLAPGDIADGRTIAGDFETLAQELRALQSGPYCEAELGDSVDRGDFVATKPAIRVIAFGPNRYDIINSKIFGRFGVLPSEATPKERALYQPACRVAGAPTAR